MAAQENHAEVVKYLLDKGANASLATEVRQQENVSNIIYFPFNIQTNRPQNDYKRSMNG